jgi:hypothetical protein
MNGDQSVRLQFPADAGTTDVVAVLSAGVAERYGLDPTDARELASAVCSAVILLIDSPLTEATPPEATPPVTNSPGATPPAAELDATEVAGDRSSESDQAPGGQNLTTSADAPTTATSAAGGIIQVTFSPDQAGLRATVARPGLWFRGMDEAERAWRRLTERIGDKVCARENPGAEAAYRFVVNRVMRGA